jgi:hypothetical protein
MTASYRNIKNSASKNYLTYDLPEELPLSNIIQGTLAFVKSVSSLYVYDSGWQPIQLSNEVPTLDNVPPATVSVPIGGSYSIDLAATDPDGLPITWSYEVVGGSLSINTLSLNQNTFSFGALDDTSFTVRFTASDSVNTITSDTVFTITNQAPSAPTLLSDGTLSVTESALEYGQTLNYEFTSVDPEGASVIWSYAPPDEDPNDVIINSALSNNVLTIIPGQDTSQQVFDITASDGKYSTTSEFNFRLQRPVFPYNTIQTTLNNPLTTVFNDYFGGPGKKTDLWKDFLIVGFLAGGVNRVYVYKKNQSNQYVSEDELDPPSGTFISFGKCVLIYDDYAYISANEEVSPGVAPGVVLIYQRGGSGTWTYVNKLTGTDVNFGKTIDIFKDKLIINNNYYTGSGSTWTLSQTISIPNYPGTSIAVCGSSWATSVAIHNNVLCISAIHRNSEITGSSISQQGLVAVFDTPLFSSVDEINGIGLQESVAIYDDTIVLGAHERGGGEGGIYIWTRPSDTNTWTLHLEYFSNKVNDHFGECVDIWDTEIVTTGRKNRSNSPYATMWIFYSSHQANGRTWPSNPSTWREFTDAELTDGFNGANQEFNITKIQWNNIVVGGYNVGTNGRLFTFSASG